MSSRVESELLMEVDLNLNDNDNDDEIGLYSDINELNDRLYTRRYKDLLVEREKLPITKWKDTFWTLLEQNRVILVNAESGAGKTTQIPQFCLEYARRFPGKKVVCSQPSTLATQHAAQRVADELDVKLGEQVAYHVPYDHTDQASSVHLLMYCTDGYLRNLVANNRVHDYAVIVVDDVHERSINIDMIIGLLKPRLENPDSKIRLVLMGARLLDVADFYAYFRGITTATLEVPGQLHNVHIIYYNDTNNEEEEAPASCSSIAGEAPPVEQALANANVKKTTTTDVVAQKKNSPNLKRGKCVRNFMVERCVAKVMEIHRRNIKFGLKVGILLIVPGKEDIKDAQQQLKEQLERAHEQGDECGVGTLDVLPLYANMPEKQLEQVFPENSICSSSNLPYVRRCIVSTNLADSYLDLKDIVYVVDSGQTKQVQYDEQMKESSIRVRSITKAIAQQRAGLAGRFQDGVCYRMYTEAEYDRLEEADPDIKHENMCSTVMKFIEKKIRIDTFQFIDKPVQALIDNAIKTLKSIGAIDDNLHLIDLGWRIKRLRLPVNPPLAAILIKSAENMRIFEELVMRLPVNPPLAAILIKSAENMRIFEELVMLVVMLDSSQPWQSVTSAAAATADDDGKQKDGPKRKLASAEDEEKRKLLAHEAWSRFEQDGDHFTLLEVFRHYSKEATEADKKKWCTDNFLLHGVLKKADHKYKELLDLLRSNGYTVVKIVNGLKPMIRTALLRGFPLQVAFYKTIGHGFCRRAEEGFYIPADAELSQEQLASLEEWGGYQVQSASRLARGRGCGSGSEWVIYHRTNGRKLQTVTGLLNPAMLIENPEVYDALATYSNEEFKRRLAALKEVEEQRAAVENDH